MMVVGAVIGGARGAVSAGVLGAVAIAIQLLAARMMYRTGIAPTVDHLKVYGAGVVMRALGVAVLAVLTLRFPQQFPPAPSVVGYLGTVLPLLYLETRLPR
jgi:hypothetical protein